jgi:hypothetical protein
MRHFAFSLKYSPKEAALCDRAICGKQEPRGLAIIEARDSEVRLDAYRETYGDGQGSGLSGEAESQFAGLRFARLAASQ